MHSTTLLTTLLSLTLLISALPTPRDIYYGISISVQTSSLLDPDPTTSPVPVQLYNLTPCSAGPDDEPCSASKLTIDPNVHPNVDINAVECRAYKDVNGTQPGSAPFNVTSPALLSTNLVDIGSILCYIVETD